MTAWIDPSAALCSGIKRFWNAERTNILGPKKKKHDLKAALSTMLMCYEGKSAAAHWLRCCRFTQIKVLSWTEWPENLCNTQECSQWTSAAFWGHMQKTLLVFISWIIQFAEFLTPFHWCFANANSGCQSHNWPQDPRSLIQQRNVTTWGCLLTFSVSETGRAGTTLTDCSLQFPGDLFSLTF